MMQIEAYRGQGLQRNRQRTKNMTLHKHTACVMSSKSILARATSTTKPELAQAPHS